MSNMDEQVKSLIASGHVKAGQRGAHLIQVWDKAAGTPVALVGEVNVQEGWAEVVAVDDTGRRIVAGGDYAFRRIEGEYELRQLRDLNAEGA